MVGHRTFIAAVIATVLAGTAPSAQDARADAPPWLGRLSSYLENVRSHRPGQLDMAARLTGVLTESDVDEARTDFLALVAICKREIARSVRSAPLVYRDTTIPYPELRALLTLTDDEAAKGNANRILQRAAMLHADVAMLVVPFLPGGAGCSSRATLLVKDGSGVGAGCIVLHWEAGRQLLDAVRPDPGKDPIVRLWYQATITYLLEIGDFANADLQIARARLLLPRDADILFQHGFYHEGVASPLLQTAAFESGSDMRGAKVHLDEAEDLYRRAVRQNPQFVEARLHHGYVLDQLGRYGDAAEELRLVAAAAAAGPRLQYYAELFLGHAEESLGNRAQARDRYMRAEALYPGAQSPLLALALLARQVGDRALAQEAMQKLLALSQTRDGDADPWWGYHRWQSRGFKDVLAELHALLPDGSQPRSGRPDAGPARAVSVCPRVSFVCPPCGQTESASVTHVLREEVGQR
jgi:tetratricopeptide (TPR) repeat protein